MQSQIESVIERPELETEEDGENSREMDANGDLPKESFDVRDSVFVDVLDQIGSTGNSPSKDQTNRNPAEGDWTAMQSASEDMYRSRSAPRLSSKYEETPAAPESIFKVSKRPKANKETILDIRRENPTDFSVQRAQMAKVQHHNNSARKMIVPRSRSPSPKVAGAELPENIKKDIRLPFIQQTLQKSVTMVKLTDPQKVRRSQVAL